MVTLDKNMNINNIKKEMEKNLGKKVKCKLNVGRNKYEKFEGVIDATYPFLFTIVHKNETKSFSYSDLLTKTLELQLK